VKFSDIPLSTGVGHGTVPVMQVLQPHRHVFKFFCSQHRLSPNFFLVLYTSCLTKTGINSCNCHLLFYCCDYSWIHSSGTVLCPWNTNCPTHELIHAHNHETNDSSSCSI